MALQKIVLTISKKSAIEVKNILYKFSSTLPQINIVKRLSDDEIEIELKLPEEISRNAIKKFASSGFAVKPIDVYTRKILFQNKSETTSSFSSPGFVLPDKIGENKETTKDRLELAETVKMILQGKNKITASNQKSIKNSLNFYIDKLRKEAFLKKSKTNDNIKRLLEIASNKMIASSPILNVAKSAGFSAIDVCAENTLNVGELLNICNNRDLHCTVRAKAVAKFSKVVFEDESFYESDLTIAVKRLNTRWLNTILDESSKDLTEDEVENFEKLQSFIKGESA